MSEWTNASKQASEWVNEWLSQWVSEQVSELVIGCVNQSIKNCSLGLQAFTDRPSTIYVLA